MGTWGGICVTPTLEVAQVQAFEIQIKEGRGLMRLQGDVFEDQVKG